MAASLNFVQIDALIDDSTRVPLTFSPAFSPEVRAEYRHFTTNSVCQILTTPHAIASGAQVTSYELHAPKAATRISIGATSFGAAQVKPLFALSAVETLPGGDSAQNLKANVASASALAPQVKVQGIPGSLSTVAVTGSGVEVSTGRTLAQRLLPRADPAIICELPTLSPASSARCLVRLC